MGRAARAADCAVRGSATGGRRLLPGAAFSHGGTGRRNRARRMGTVRLQPRRRQARRGAARAGNMAGCQPDSNIRNRLGCREAAPGQAEHGIDPGSPRAARLPPGCASVSPTMRQTARSRVRLIGRAPVLQQPASGTRPSLSQRAPETDLDCASRRTSLRAATASTGLGWRQLNPLQGRPAPVRHPASGSAGAAWRRRPPPCGRPGCRSRQRAG